MISENGYAALQYWHLGYSERKKRTKQPHVYRSLQYAESKSPGTGFGKYCGVALKGSSCDADVDGTSHREAFCHVSNRCSVLYLSDMKHPSSVQKNKAHEKYM